MAGTDWTEADWEIMYGFDFPDWSPNHYHWIKLLDAVKYIERELKVLPGEAQYLLQLEAIPPAVPWVGKIRSKVRELGPGGQLVETNKFTTAAQAIQRFWLVDAEFSFDSGTVIQSGRHMMFHVHVERNHLEAWLRKKRPATGHVQPDQSSSAKPRVNGGRPPLPLKGDVQLALEAFRVKRGAAWLKDRTTGQLAKELRKAFDNKKPPVSLPARSTLEGWIDEWRSEQKL